ncbi:MAG: hypothetical protein ACYTGQ_02165 [Planctomycetota bacterium]|jgi:hypothetical protein
MNQEIEQQLKRQNLRAPSAELDRRMDDLFAADTAPASVKTDEPETHPLTVWRWFTNPAFARAAALIIALPAVAWLVSSALQSNTPPTPTTPHPGASAGVNISVNPLPSPQDSMIRFDHTITHIVPGRPMLAGSPINPPSPSEPTPTDRPPDNPATRNLFPTLPNPDDPATVPTVVRPLYEQHVNYTRWHNPETGVTIELSRPHQNVRYIALPVY